MPISGSKKSQYNREYYKRTKKGGHSERRLHLHVSLPASLVGRLHRLTIEAVATGAYPWRTLGQCVEDLLVNGIRTYRHTDAVSEMLPSLEHQQHIDKVRAARLEAMRMLNSAREEIAELLGIKQAAAAATYYHMTLDSARRLPDTEWSAWMIRELRKAFPELDKMPVKGVNLTRVLKHTPKKKAAGGRP